MIFVKIILWFIIPLAYFLFISVSFVEFKSLGDANSFQLLSNLNNKIFYWTGIGGWLFPYFMKKPVVWLIEKEYLYANEIHQYSILVSVTLLGMACVSVLWKCIFLMTKI